ncbi:preprotein translocase subunit SecE [Paenibacillus thermoaerophilus]|uniref:Protein translocase subunit SecE n=1 Tax=Paenibacillus thermoaerophilus TaxID=1215385 RepID=A0ABW2V1S4_9BACL|nr:preprotein translocase subunit SecE [Paenibacillus thermoaerophilus]TMV10981.1 preprotein translocase subunit SecE [Paenibacillus thermoaerophilus]
MAFLASVKRGFGSAFSFVSESIGELKKVKWPTRKELVSYTTVVLVSVAFVTVYFWGLDSIISWLLRLAFE